MKKKVVLLERIFSHYRKPVYDRLAQKLDLLLLHGSNNSGIKTTHAPYARQIPSWQYSKSETTVVLFPLREIIKFEAQLLICDLALGMLNLPIILAVCKLFNIKVAFWSHGYNRKTGFQPYKSLKDGYRLGLLKSVDANIVYSENDKTFLQNFLDKKKLFVAQNTLDTQTLGRIKDELETEGINHIKSRLNIKHKYNLVFIGRMLASKKPELLISVGELLIRKYRLNVGLHFVGEGERLSLVKELARSKSLNEHCYFHGSLYDDHQSGALLYMGDLMLMPGAIGLSVNHAFCFDCPVVSFQKARTGPFHGPEVGYVLNGETGYLVAEQNPAALADIIYQHLTDPRTQHFMIQNLRRTVKHVFPIEKMVDGVMECVNYLSKKSLVQALK